MIAEQNVEKSNNNNNNTYEKAHFEMVKNFLRSDDPSARKLTITKLPPNTNKPASTSSQRGRLPFRRDGGDSERKPRPHSMSALPSASEADFTELLAGLMNENGVGDGIESATNNTSLGNGGASSAR